MAWKESAQKASSTLSVLRTEQLGNNIQHEKVKYKLAVLCKNKLKYETNTRR